VDTPWGEWTKWWMDLLKWVITFLLGAVLSFFVVDRLQEKRLKERAKADAMFRLRLDALQQFQRALATYDVAALSAYTDLYQWRGKTKTSSMEWYERQAYSGWLVAVDDLDKRFPTCESIQQKLAALRKANAERHRLYDRWVDKRLDGSDTTPITPAETRGQFDTLSGQIAGLRADVIDKIEDSVLRDSTPRALGGGSGRA
jgi:hypothetical protein